MNAEGKGFIGEDGREVVGEIGASDLLGLEGAIEKVSVFPPPLFPLMLPPSLRICSFLGVWGMVANRAGVVFVLSVPVEAAGLIAAAGFAAALAFDLPFVVATGFLTAAGLAVTPPARGGPPPVVELVVLALEVLPFDTPAAVRLLMRLLPPLGANMPGRLLPSLSPASSDAIEETSESCFLVAASVFGRERGGPVATRGAARAVPGADLVAIDEGVPAGVVVFDAVVLEEGGMRDAVPAFLSSGRLDILEVSMV